MNDFEKRKRTDLVNQDKVRRGLDGSKGTHNISMLNSTWRLINRIVETGKGKYGSAFVDHATRFFIAILSGDEDNMKAIIEELEHFVVTPSLSDSLRKMADIWDSRGANIDL